VFSTFYEIAQITSISLGKGESITKMSDHIPFSDVTVDEKRARARLSKSSVFDEVKRLPAPNRQDWHSEVFVIEDDKTLKKIQS
jgi:hypothetical protein